MIITYVVLMQCLLTATSNLILRMNRDWWRVALQSWTGGVSADLPVSTGGGADGIRAVQGGAAVALSAVVSEGKHTVTAA